MKKRNPLAVVFLSLITFGIYDLYWLAKTRKELNNHATTKIPTIWLLLSPYILIIGSIILVLVFLAASGVKTASTSGAYNFGSTDATTTTTHNVGLLVSYGILWLFIIVFLVISIYWFFKFSKAVNEYTQGKMSTAVCFLVLYLIHLIGVALIQDTFNDMIDGVGTFPPQAPIAVGGPMPPVNPQLPTVPPVNPQPTIAPQPPNDPTQNNPLS